jgi:hypothetical protein
LSHAVAIIADANTTALINSLLLIARSPIELPLEEPRERKLS